MLLATLVWTGVAQADIVYVPGVRGNAGTWAILGPYPAARGLDTIVPEVGVESSLKPQIGVAFGSRTKGREGQRQPIAWRVGHSQGGAIDLAKELDTSDGNQIAYASTGLKVASAGTYWLVLSVDDGVRVFLDGKAVQSRTGRQSFREDNELVPLSLSAGDHTLTVKLHQDNAGWSFHARLLAGDFSRASSLTLTLPGAQGAPQPSLTLERQITADGTYRLLTRVRADEGVALAGVPLTIDTSTGALFFGKLTPKEPELTAEVRRMLPEEAEGAPSVLTFHVDDKVVTRQLAFRAKTREALMRADEALRVLDPSVEPSATLEFLARRLRGYVSRFDPDLDAQDREASELLAIATAAIERRDLLLEREGPMRRAVRSPLDGQPSEFALYVPKAAPTKPMPLIVALHGMNGHAMSMLRWFFGGDDEKRDQEWEDRHVTSLPYLDAFVVAPAAHGNAFYRGPGEASVLQAIDWVKGHYPIDPRRITITGPSMGGIGTAALAFHHPNLFAAAAPLCGYHSAFIRGDVAGFKLSPWEHFMVSARSNVEWAVNGAHIPLYIVHGTKDLPEANSGVLIDRYEQMHYTLKHEHPDLGHNVWQTTYEGFKGARWLLAHRKPEAGHVRFRTASARFGVSGPVHVHELMASGTWAEVQSRKTRGEAFSTSTTGVRELGLEVPTDKESVWTLDGTSLTFAPGEALVAHREGPQSPWHKGARVVSGLAKRGSTVGPIRDVFYDPLTFVIGTHAPQFTTISMDVAKAFARYKPGADLEYPIVSDDDPTILQQDRSLFLVGNAQSNRVIEALERTLPVRINDDKVVLGTKSFSGNQVGVIFTFPHPKFPRRMIVVVEAPTPEGLFRALSLPDLLPDFMVYDESLARTQGQTVLGPGKALAAGFFDNDWQLSEEYR